MVREEKGSLPFRGCHLSPPLFTWVTWNNFVRKYLIFSTFVCWNSLLILVIIIRQVSESETYFYFILRIHCFSKMSSFQNTCFQILFCTILHCLEYWILNNRNSTGYTSLLYFLLLFSLFSIKITIFRLDSFLLVIKNLQHRYPWTFSPFLLEQEVLTRNSIRTKVKQLPIQNSY